MVREWTWHILVYTVTTSRREGLRIAVGWENTPVTIAKIHHFVANVML